MSIKRRRPLTSNYVYTDDQGLLHVKAPAICGNWDNQFRTRIISNWAKPSTVISQSTFIDKYNKAEYATKEYKIHGKRLRIHYKYTMLDSPKNSMIINATCVKDLSTGISIEVNHETAAMRMLQIYCFVTGESIGGVPTPKTHRD